MCFAEVHFARAEAPTSGDHLNVIEDAHLLRRDPDVLRSGRSTYRIAEPLLTFYHVAMRPEWARLETGHAGPVWRNARARFLSQVLGPHFEQLCREWILANVDAPVGGVGVGSLTDPAAKAQIEVDMIALEPVNHGAKRKVVGEGEAKWGDTVGSHHVQRLRRAVELLEGRGYDVSETKILCFSGSGFDPEITKFDRVSCVSLDDLVG